MNQNDCLFCRIATGEIPAIKVFEDDDTVAFMDIFPAVQGHLLVISKRHAADLEAIDDAELSAVMRRCRRLAAPLRRALGADGLRVMQFNGAAAGQTVFHYHVHLRPAFRDRPSTSSHGERQADPAELERTAALIRAELMRE